LNSPGVSLLGSRFERTLDFQGSTVTGKLNAERIEVGGYLLLRGGGTFAAIDLVGAKIGGDVQLGGSTFTGEINATGARIGGELHVSSKKRGSPTWKTGARLILRNASADALQAQPDAWQMAEGEAGHLPTDLTGFTYNRFGGLWVSSGEGMGDASADWLIQWIADQHHHGSHYDPQPYEQLAKVLNVAGATDKAKAIHYAKFLHRIDHDSTLEWWEQAWLSAQRWVVGFGVYPHRVLFWFGGLVALGAILACFSRDKAVRRFPYPLWYSMENALPLVDIHPSFHDTKQGNRWLDSFFHIQKVLGFLLATILVGALTLLGG
jgi:hypothetical protein